MTPFVLGLVGDSGSGKSTMAKALVELLGPERVTDLKLDDYHRFTRAERKERGLTALNPMVHNVPLMAEHLQLLRSGRQIRNRSYEHADGSFGPIRVIEPREIVLVRGLLGYPSDELRALYDLAVFLEPEPELLFRWKLRRDVHSRGYTEAEVLNWIARHLLDSKQFVLPQAQRADVVVRYAAPDPDAPDGEIETRIVLRGGAAEALQRPELRGFVEQCAELRPADSELVLRPARGIAPQQLEAWARTRMPHLDGASRLGRFRDADGELRFQPGLAVGEVVIAALAEALRG